MTLPGVPAPATLHPDSDVWLYDEGAFLAGRTALHPLRSPLSAALVREVLAVADPVEAARRAAASCARPLSEALYGVSAWSERGWLVPAPLAVGPGATSDVQAYVLDAVRGRTSVRMATGLDDGSILDALDAGPLLVVVAVGEALWIGPTLTPDDRDAFAAVQARIRRTHPTATLVRHLGATLVRPALPVTDAAAWKAAAPWLAAPERLRGRVAVIARDGSTTRTHRLWETTPFRFRVPVGAPDGGYRTVAPADTLRRLRTLTTPIAGPVAAIRRARTPARGLTMVLGAHALVNDPVDLDHLLDHRTWSAGKGVSAAQARASAVCEALERHCGVWRGDEPVRRAAFRDLIDRDPGGAIHPDALQGFSAAQVAARRAHDPSEALVSRVPEPFDAAAEILWTDARSLVTGRAHAVPAAWAYYATPDPAGQAFVVCCSNGAAAGNTRDEAVLQGLLELVERDAVAMWWYHRLARPAVDLDAVAHPTLDAVRAACARLDREVWALDLTHDLGVPVVAALSRRRSEVVGGPEHVVFGFGAHLDPAIALLRALSELVQALPYDALLPRRRGAVPGIPDWGAAATRWLTTATVAGEPYLRPGPQAAVRVPSQPVPPERPLGEIVDGLVARVAGAVGDVLVVDQSRADVPLDVVKVVAPGLRHFWPRFAPGRLYDVPVALGWTDGPTPESDLNPWPMFA